jgi:hypothetical protein
MLAPVLRPEKAEAAWPTFDAANIVQTTLSAAYNMGTKLYTGLTALSTEAVKHKELTMDGIAFALINKILQQMSKQIVTWINGGFNGSPAFIQNFGGFMTEIADKTSGEFIWGSNLNFLCSPFNLDIRLALDIQYAQTRHFGTQNQCTLSGTIANMKNFLNGNFVSGGWDEWYKVTMTPQNNQYGALLMAQTEFSAKLSNSKGKEAQVLSFGKGFLSRNECIEVTSGPAAGRTECSVVTPGTAIEQQLNSTLDSGRQRIQVADEINEIVAALFSQLASKALSGVGGLLALTESGGTGGTYYDNLSRQAPGATLTQNPIQTSITAETTYSTFERSLATLLEDAARYKTDIYGGSACHDGTLTSELKAAYTKALSDFSTSQNTLVVLNTLLVQYTGAGNNESGIETQSIVMQKYLDLQSSGVLHTTADVSILKENDIPLIKDLITTFKAGIDTVCFVDIRDGSAGI